MSLNGKIAGAQEAGQGDEGRGGEAEGRQQREEQIRGRASPSLKSKLDIITTIKAQRYLPIRLFDELTAVLDKDTPVWLTKFSINKRRRPDGGLLPEQQGPCQVRDQARKDTLSSSKVDLLYSDKTKKA